MVNLNDYKNNKLISIDNRLNKCLKILDIIHQNGGNNDLSKDNMHNKKNDIISKIDQIKKYKNIDYQIIFDKIDSIHKKLENKIKNIDIKKNK